MNQPSEKLLQRVQAFKDKYPAGMIMTRFEMAMLAEEIVRECAETSSGIAGNEPDGIYEAGYDAGARMAAATILRKFGLKE